MDAIKIEEAMMFGSLLFLVERYGIPDEKVREAYRVGGLDAAHVLVGYLLQQKQWTDERAALLAREGASE